MGLPNERGPSAADVIERHVRAILRDVHTSIPGRVERVYGDGDEIRLDVQPLIKNWRLDEAGNRIVADVPLVTNVPVEWPEGGGFCVTFPIAVGDFGKLTFGERSLDRWLAGNGIAVDPEVYHRHDLSDATFSPGLRPFGNPLRGVPRDHAAIGKANGLRIHLRDNTITIGDEAGSKFIVLDGDAVNAASTMATWIADAQVVLAAAAVLVGKPPPTLPTDFGTASASATQAKAK